MSIEGKANNDVDEWVMLLDLRDNETDSNCDYNTFPAVSCESVKLTIYSAPKGITLGIIDFTVFGTRDETV